MSVQMKLVSIDVRMARHTGIGRYIRGLLSFLNPHPAAWQYQLIGNPEFKALFPQDWPYRETSDSIYSLREQLNIPKIAENSDCLHTPHYNAPVLWKKKLIVTIHDLIHLHFKEDLSSGLARLYAGTMLPQIVKRADHIISVSQSTKDDMVRKLGANPAKITVVHHGIDPSFLTDLPKAQPKAPYFLCVGLLKKHKNVGVLIDAFLKLRQKSGFSEMNLILVGTPDRKQQTVNEWLVKISNEKSIQLLNNISDEELKILYRRATALVCPSLYEGFGFPLLEAMASRIPVIAAKTSTMLEVLGQDNGLFFDPHSAAELEKQMEAIVQSKDLCDQFIKKGTERLKSFDWKSAARKTEQVYESVLSG